VERVANAKESAGRAPMAMTSAQLVGEVLAVLLVVVSAACSGHPTAPTSLDRFGASVTGTWTQVGGTRTWFLTQTGANVAGGSSFSQDDNVYLGAVSGDGIVQGGVGLGVFNFDDTYVRLLQANCSLEITGQLKVSGDSMTGPYTENDSCNGALVGRLSGTLAMQKK
jgi:hypothetical protein